MTAHRFWRFANLTASGAGVQVTEFELRTVVGTPLTPSGGTPSAQEAPFGGFDPPKACDGNTATAWATNVAPSWWQYDYGAGNEKDIVECAITNRGAVEGASPTSFDLSYSDDGVTFTVLQSFIAGTWHAGPDQQVFTVSATPVRPVARHYIADSQVAAIAPYTTADPSVRVSVAAALVAYAPKSTRDVRDGQSAALVVYRVDAHNKPHDSQLTALVVYREGLDQEQRSRAWAFTLDGHPFYVLDLGDEGTFLYDSDTQQWCQFQTDGYTGWNIRNGTRWGEPERVVGADTVNALVWELDPDLTIDEGFRDITHMVTGGVMTRERIARSVEAVRIAGSLGALTSDTGTTITLEFSDDGGETYPYSFTVDLTQGDFSGAVEWRSLGSFQAPGRVFRVTDVGGMLRIDGADVYIDGWDGEGMTSGNGS
jgi:hypothetical protein